MRLAWYAGASTALAASVIISAFHQRANFYSAMVYLSQSSLCLLILVNLVFLVYGSFMYGLQRLCFGQLRPVEIEQLYEKAWFAVTETCLAMTIFREEVGAFFLIMFAVLVTGKVWGWIGDGRLEILEQQPPANPRLFHTRLSISLILSVVYDFCLLHFAVWTVIDQARPNMMVMFLFEFAILAICSVHTGLRYILSLVEARIVKTQTQQRLEDRRRQVREERNEILRRRETEGITDEGQDPLPSEDDIDEMDIEVPGWEAKGQWVLSLDLLSDFVKLGIYAAFFFVLLRFYGLPIHIMRDLFMTTRSFVKRLGALLKYRQALRDMDKYADATDEELVRENTCIVCREEMHQWDPNNPGQVERSRPKKLPCGHILHFGCLKSWLERQQVCPICRRSVVIDNPSHARIRRDAVVFRVGLNLQPGGGAENQQGQVNGLADAGQNAQQGGQQPQQQQQQQGQRGARNGIRMFNLGPLRLGFAQGGLQEFPEIAQQLGMPAGIANGAAGLPAPQAVQQPATTTNLQSSEAIRSQLRDIDHRIQQEIQGLQHTHQELQTLHLLVQELGRLRQLAQLQNPGAQGSSAPAAGTPQTQAAPRIPLGQQPLPMFQPPSQQLYLGAQQHPFGWMGSSPQPVPPMVTRHGGAAYTTTIPAGSPDLPEGVVIPQGWSLLPLQRLDGASPNLLAPHSATQMQSPFDMTQPFMGSHNVPGASQQSPGHITGSSGAAQGSSANPSTSNAQVEPVQQSHQRSTPTPASLQAQTGEPSTAAAPTPTMPNWGGSAQLFPGHGGSIFGMQPARGQSAASTTNGENDQNNQARASAHMEGPSVGSSTGGEHGEENGGPTDKGEARAVTVEEASDDDDDE